MKKLFLFPLMAFAALALSQCAKNDEGSGEQGGGHKPDDSTSVTDEYVDLGLMSMTMWKSANEKNAANPDNDFFTYDEAVATFGNSLPTREQFMELRQSCEWHWVDAGYYIVVGPNKNYILLPAEGFCDCMGEFCYPRTYGFYWSSTPNGSTKAWYLNFYRNNIYMYNDKRCYANSVRLIKNCIVKEGKEVRR